MPADDRNMLLQLLSVEGQVAQMWQEASQGMGPNDEIFISEIEYGLDEEEDKDDSD